MSRELAPGRYGFAQLRPGDWWRTGRARVTEAEIDRFADLTGDRFEIHMDAAAAARYGFAGRVAHGLLILSMIDGLKNLAPVQMNAVASLGWTWTFSAPVLAGAEIGARIRVDEIRETSRKGRGVLALDFDVTDQSGVTVQKGVNKLMVYAEDAPPV